MKLSTKRGALIVNGVLAVLLLGGAGIAYSSLGGGVSSASSADAAVRTVPVTRATVVASVSASGTVDSARKRSLGFASSGTVEKIYVKVGDKVTKGQILARLDDSAAQESLDAAAAALDSADDDTSTAAAYAEYVTARNAYRAARRAVQGTVIKAPFAGTVTAVNGTVGGSSGASGSSGSSGAASSASGSSGSGASPRTGTSGGSASASASGGSGGFIDIADTRRLQLVGTFTESDVTRLKVGQAAAIRFDALPGVTATGKITQIQPTASTSNNVVQYPVTISFTEVPEEVRLGQTATVQVIAGRAENVLAVPSTVISTAGGRSVVTVLRDGRQTPTPVEVGVKGDALTEITSGLTEGDQVVRPAATQQGGGFPGLGGGGGARGGMGGIGR
ncbi:macrolide-specific efflux system membrane fusion protein [Streptosporangium becharense]|uniref:Macrolide-specific efflux system membrane fusion protein n=1 Tax=Streptosporangium becharense TaxID=1816182 RepID=A0A7W9IHL0_9ACTN|nr:biotin/lipoyl-binding protein [Streptosporangium becharense]MBB2914724.1 macrolide-specific efflux system membrane fusion protein [Streptosporangium becharense]MBB5820875.1 macrolide-specific efflux system membrane fusion protein [Streptosporangium becharense]